MKRKDEMNERFKRNLHNTAEFILDEDSQALLAEDRIEELYERAADEGISEWDVTQILGAFSVDMLSYLKKLRYGVVHYTTDILVIPDQVEEIEGGALCGLKKLGRVLVGCGVKKIGNHVFVGDEQLTEINYNGTQEQWRAIDRNIRWATNSKIEKVVCKDGKIDVKEEYEQAMREKAIAHGRANLNLLRGIDGVNDVIQSFDGDEDVMKSVLREAGIKVE